MTDNNKDYIINLRVSRATYEKIKKKAFENKENISTFVRKAIDDSAEIMKDLSHDLFGEKKNQFKDIVSYHKAKMAKDMKCDLCGTLILSGSIGTIGETASSKKYFFCTNCR